MNTPSKLTAWERWELASFDPPPAEPDPHPEPKPEEDTAPPPGFKLPTAGEIEQILQEARRQGYEKGIEEGREEGHQLGQQAGHTEGYAAGQAEARAEAERLSSTTNQLEHALNELETQVADELLALAMELARGVIRREISAHPEGLLTVVREAIGQLPQQHAAIYLHPEDASLLRSYMGDQLSHAGHRIHENFKLKRGDCILEAGGSQIDATVAMRWRRVLEEIGIESAWQTEQAELDLHGGKGS